MGRKLLEIENLKKSFADQEVLRGISFSVEEGEVLAIIGSSGSGKSTLLRCVTMLEAVNSGTIRVCDRTLVEGGDGEPLRYADKQTEKEIQLSLGMVFQSFNLFPHYTVLKNVTDAPIRILGKSREEATSTAVRLLESMDLGDRIDYYPCQLSGGQQQRVAIARAVAMEPEILCFDEPTSALDPELTGEVLRSIRNLKNEGRTMIVVTHEMDFARNVADRVIFMSGGVIVEQGDAKEVFDHPQSEQLKSFLQHAEESF